MEPKSALELFSDVPNTVQAWMLAPAELSAYCAYGRERPDIATNLLWQTSPLSCSHQTLPMSFLELWSWWLLWYSTMTLLSTTSHLDQPRCVHLSLSYWLPKCFLSCRKHLPMTCVCGRACTLSPFASCGGFYCAKLINSNQNGDCLFAWRRFEASVAASAGETNSYLAWTQLAQKLGVYNIIEFKHYNSNLIIFYNYTMFYSFKL